MKARMLVTLLDFTLPANPAATFDWLRSPRARRRANSRAQRSTARTSSRPEIVRPAVPLVGVHRLRDDVWNRRETQTMRRRNSATATSLAAFSTIGRPTSPCERPKRQRQAGEPRRVRRLELEPAGAGQIERRERRRPALRVRERILNRQPHVGHAELRDDRSIHELDHRVDDRLRVDDDVDLLGPTSNSQCASMTSSPLFISVAESMVIFGPIRHVGWRSASSGVTSCEPRGGQLAERPARCGQDQPADLARLRAPCTH